MTLGPFEITVEQVQALGLRFTEFVNRLLVLEQMSSDLSGHLLRITSLEAVADGGVDASTRDVSRSHWMPDGDTAWQFKRGDLQPAECAAELKAATWAQEFLRSGGCYVLVLGKGLTEAAAERRRMALATKAVELGLIAADNRRRIRLYDGNALSRWASHYPALAVSRLAGGPGSMAIDFEAWSRKRPHQRSWIPDVHRESAIAGLRVRIQTVGVVDLRVQGDSGVGKTRLVLEALREAKLSPLVAYVDDPSALSGELIQHLIDDRRTVILVVDECPADRHAKLTDQLPADTTLKLITIGQAGPAMSPTPLLVVDPMPTEKVEEFLKANYNNLSPEARRFVAHHSRGNMRWTIVLAERVRHADAAQAADLIRRDDITAFITSVLPEGKDFFCSAVLALLDRVGWDRELRYQLEDLAAFAGRSPGEMEDLGRQLEHLGLLARHGRFRSIEPHPLAVFLAAEAWRTEARRIVEELLPKLDDHMALALFQRVADLGRFEPARSVLPALLSGGGPFSSLKRIEHGRLGGLLTQLAIVLPDEVAVHLGELIEAEPGDGLRAATRTRRDLVWTLEKLAWHRRTFDLAANALLRLALAENETFANNATGTWIELFGTLLPGTAATPPERAAYLGRRAADARPEVRLLTIKAISHAFQRHEAIAVSGELQAGALVEPRGTPRTFGEAQEYRETAIGILETLVNDDDDGIRRGAEEALIGALVQLLDDASGARLVESLARLRGAALVRLRTEAERLMGIYDRHVPENKMAVDRLQVLIEALPEASRLERLNVLTRLQRWDMGEGEFQPRLDEAIRSLDRSELSSALTLLDQELPAAWELGHALALSTAEEAGVLLEALVSKFPENPAAVAGYLSGRVEMGDKEAFDNFLDSAVAKPLELRARVFVAVRGPVTERAKARILSALTDLSVANGTYLLFGWHRNLDQAEVATLLSDWTSRVSSQADYNALIDWLNLWVHGNDPFPDSLRAVSLRILLLRSNYPALSQQQWDWSHIAENFVDSHPAELADVLLECIESGSLMVHEGDEDSKVLLGCARRRPREIWEAVAERMENGSWRVQMEIGGWLLGAVPIDIVRDWVGVEVRRAWLVAAIAPVGTDRPTDFTRFLLEKFGTDRQVSSSLFSSFVTGSWMGPESSHLKSQVEQLNAWRQQATEPLAVRDWARQMVEHLEEQARAAVEREAEERV